MSKQRTLGWYRDLAPSLGLGPPAIEWLDAKIRMQGRDEPVVQDEGQMLHWLFTLSTQKPKRETP
jgi:hypothetical protein